MITRIQDILFDTLVIFGLVLLIAVIFYTFLWILNKIGNYSKYTIMYMTYKKNKTLYETKDKLVLTKDGSIVYTCITDVDEQIKILEKAIQNCKDIKNLANEFKQKS